VTPRFDGGISREALEGYLSRAVTMGDAIHSDTVEDDLRMVGHIGARFLGRAAAVWVPDVDDDAHFALAGDFARRVHAIDRDIILQACIFEAIYPTVEAVHVPAWAFEALDLPVEDRCFRFEAMTSPAFRAAYRWKADGTVPDITTTESQLWFYYRARRYLDAGFEALHLGQVHLYGGRDAGYTAFADLLQRIRACAADHARRGWVLLDAHTHGIARHGHLLLDFHSRPMSARMIPDQPQRLALMLKGRSLGGVTPSGWGCDSLPTLIEVDNWGGISGDPTTANWQSTVAGNSRWGYDDIAWFAHQPAAERDAFVQYAHFWSRLRDPALYFQPPIRRTLGLAPVITRPSGTQEERSVAWYKANRPGAGCHDGFGQEETIRALWQQPDPRHSYPPAAEAPTGVLANGQDAPALVALVGNIQAALGGVPGDSICPHSRMTHIGDGVYELLAVIPWPGEYRCTVAVGGTMTEVYRQDGLAAGRPWTVRAERENAVVRIRFDYVARQLTATQ
jgi:hypothetical protein